MPALRRLGTARHGRLAALCCLLLLALAGSGARAACTTGQLKVDLFAVGGSGACASSPYAGCLTSFTLRASGSSSCSVTLTPLAPSGALPRVSTPAGSGYAAAGNLLCPADPASAAVADAAPLAAILEAARGLLDSYLWSQAVGDVVAAPSVDAGTLAFTAGGCALQYRITESAGIDGAATANCSASGCQTDGPCAAGQYPLDVAGATKVCALCAPGSYADAGASACSPCASGTAAPGVGAAPAGCAACAPGSYSSGDGNSNCLPCDAGSYQGQAGADSCLDCPDSSYAHLPGAATCVLCAGGRPSACTQDSCSGTPSDGYASAAIASLGSLSSATCAAAGWGAGVAAWAPRPALMETCAMSTATRLSLYVSADCSVEVSVLGQGACSDPTDPARPFLSAYYTSPTEISSVLDEVSGDIVRISASGGGSLTLSVFTGTLDPAHYADAGATCSGALAVTGGSVAGAGSGACPAGTRRSGDGDGLSCIPCPVGQYCDVVDATAGTPCPAGTSNGLLGAASSDACQPCGAGAFSPAGSDSCSLCPVGTFSAADTAEACLPCDNGGAAVPGATTCSLAGACPSGQQYNAVADDCESCDPGWVSDGTVACAACPAGTAPNGDLSACVACGDGAFAPSAGMEACLTCPAGSKRNATTDADATTCVHCDAGYVSNARTGSTSCTACPASTYRAGTATPANNVCVACRHGFATDLGLAATTCSRCAKGSYRGPGMDPASCAACPSGAVATRSASSMCQLCRPGTAPNNDSTACVTCATGTYRPAFSTSNVCRTCGAGHETRVTYGGLACVDCGPGYYNGGGTPGGATTDAAGLLTDWQPSCSACPAGTYQSDSGAASCLGCPAGSSTGDDGNAACQLCVPGTYSATVGGACLDCPVGSYAPGWGSTACRKCPIGTTTADTGSETCDPCGAGTYAPFPGSSSCRTCPAGSVSRDGAGACKTCPEGFSAPSGSAACVACAKGSYNPTRGAAACVLCPAGSFCDVPTLRAPKPCPAGSFSSRAGSDRCSSCRANTYADAPGAPGCKPCPKGSTTERLSGQTACTAAAPRRMLR